MSNLFYRVLICVPSYPYVEPETLKSAENQQKYFSGMTDIFIGVYNHCDPTSARWGENLVRKQNDARRIVFNLNYTHLFLIEADVIPPENALNELMKLNKAVASGWYRLHSHSEDLEGKTSIFQYRDKRLVSLRPDVDFKPPEVVKVDFSILGCTLIQKNVLWNVKFDIGIDASFSQGCKQHGHDMWVHTGVKCDHKDRYKKEGI